MSMPALFKGRLSIPVIGSPLFIISVPDLVIAQCKAGVVGSFPALNARPASLLDEWIAKYESGQSPNWAAASDARHKHDHLCQQVDALTRSEIARRLGIGRASVCRARPTGRFEM